MTKEEVNNLPHGVYLIEWKPLLDSRKSIASVGSDSTGKRWFAPTNWISGSAVMETHAESIFKVVLIIK